MRVNWRYEIIRSMIDVSMCWFLSSHLHIIISFAIIIIVAMIMPHSNPVILDKVISSQPQLYKSWGVVDLYSVQPSGPDYATVYVLFCTFLHTVTQTSIITQRQWKWKTNPQNLLVLTSTGFPKSSSKAAIWHWNKKPFQNKIICSVHVHATNSKSNV